MDCLLSLIPVAIAVVAAMAVAALWYSPFLFGKTWMKLSNVSQKDTKGIWKGYVIGFFVMGVTVTLISLLLYWTDLGNSIIDAAYLGLLLWLGFSAATKFGTVFWEKKPVKFFLINTGYDLIYFILSAVIITAYNLYL